MILNDDMLRCLCRTALAEDVGSGDATTLAVVPEHLETEAHFITRQECVCAGLPIVAALFAELDRNLVVTPHVQEGAFCRPGTTLATVAGPARAILTGERTALNFLQRLCGVATVTRRYVTALGDSSTRILDTRKTTPGMRLLEKYAVTMGGGQNHRLGLYDRIMIKDNHREMAKFAGPDSIARAVRACREKYPRLEIEVEADSLEEAAAAAAAGVEYILLDNMTDAEMAEAIRIIAGRARTEASGGITLERLPRLRNLGLDFISVGALTHSAPAIDIGLDIICPEQ
ncbi:MAG: carboxylating nicotinate-nucleotide diphosphorylase [Lentisphaerae bacterium]|nr:carboxylating nicotinate-nucleotide diphosphorylase [Lentisphaerota bacterium]HQL88502.1 carboxylating nicotinate-nucleotide diphosphorylase [Lentisphaeria bacterium]